MTIALTSGKGAPSPESGRDSVMGKRVGAEAVLR